MNIACVYIRNDRHNLVFMRRNVYESAPFGISYIISSLKSAGHNVEAVFCNTVNSISKELKLLTEETQLLVVSLTGEMDWSLAGVFVKKAKKKFPHAKIILGGVFVTLSPQTVFQNSNVDAICIGEGEFAIANFAKMVDTGVYEKTDNLWIKNGSKVLKCDKISLTENLDDLPFPDIQAWRKYAHNPHLIEQYRHILLTRGCNYKCIYCANDALSKIYGKNYARSRSAQNVISEIEYLQNSFPNLQKIIFESENVLLDKQHFKNLCQLLIDYNASRKQKLTFLVKLNFSQDLLKDNIAIAALMQKANIERALFALESGCENIRKILKRPHYDNAGMLAFAKELTRLGISTEICVIYNYPFETADSYKKTLEFLWSSRPDKITASWLTPFKGSALCDMRLRKTFNFKKLVHIYRYKMLYFRAYIAYKNFFDILSLSFERHPKILKVIKFFENLKKSRGERLRLRASNAYQKNNFSLALKYYKKRERVLKGINVGNAEFWIHKDIAVSYMNTHDIQNAEKYFIRAQNSAMAAGNEEVADFCRKEREALASKTSGGLA